MEWTPIQIMVLFGEEPELLMLENNKKIIVPFTYLVTHSETGEFINIVMCQESPREPGKYLLPAMVVKKVLLCKIGCYNFG